MKQKHAELIKAWADGAHIQVLTRANSWDDIDFPCWVNDHDYRIKPEQEPDVVLRTFLRPVTSIGLVYNEGAWNDERANISLTFDGETGKLKSAEVL